MSSISVQASSDRRNPLPSRSSAHRRHTCRVRAQPPAAKDVDFATKQVAPNRWKIIAATKVNAPKRCLWASLTDYDHLQDFIPGLVTNVCSSRTADGCVLTQVAAQKVAFATVNVRAVLRVREHKGGLPRHMVGDLATFPEPIDWNAASEPWDITFSMVDGDFQMFNGVWRMQEAASKADGSILSYHLLVSPPVFLPVALIQGFIEREVRNNIIAVRAHALSIAGTSNRNGAHPSGSLDVKERVANHIR